MSSARVEEASKLGSCIQAPVGWEIWLFISVKGDYPSELTLLNWTAFKFVIMLNITDLRISWIRNIFLSSVTVAFIPSNAWSTETKLQWCHWNTAPHGTIYIESEVAYSTGFLQSGVVWNLNDQSWRVVCLLQNFKHRALSSISPTGLGLWLEIVLVI